MPTTSPRMTRYHPSGVTMAKPQNRRRHAPPKSLAEVRWTRPNVSLRCRQAPRHHGVPSDGLSARLFGIQRHRHRRVQKTEVLMALCEERYSSQLLWLLVLLNCHFDENEREGRAKPRAPVLLLYVFMYPGSLRGATNQHDPPYPLFPFCYYHRTSDNKNTYLKERERGK